MTAVPLTIPGWLQSLADQFYLNFIKDDRYMYLVRGLKITLEVTVLSLILGDVLLAKYDPRISLNADKGGGR